MNVDDFMARYVSEAEPQDEAVEEEASTGMDVNAFMTRYVEDSVRDAPSVRSAQITPTQEPPSETYPVAPKYGKYEPSVVEDSPIQSEQPTPSQGLSNADRISSFWSRAGGGPRQGPQDLPEMGERIIEDGGGETNALVETLKALSPDAWVSGALRGVAKTGAGVAQLGAAGLDALGLTEDAEGAVSEKVDAANRIIDALTETASPGERLGHGAGELAGEIGSAMGLGGAAGAAISKAPAIGGLARLGAGAESGIISRMAGNALGGAAAGAAEYVDPDETRAANAGIAAVLGGAATPVFHALGRAFGTRSTDRAKELIADAKEWNIPLTTPDFPGTGPVTKTLQNVSEILPETLGIGGKRIKQLEATKGAAQSMLDKAGVEYRAALDALNVPKPRPMPPEVDEIVDALSPKGRERPLQVGARRTEPLSLGRGQRAPGQIQRQADDATSREELLPGREGMDYQRDIKRGLLAQQAAERRAMNTAYAEAADAAKTADGREVNVDLNRYTKALQELGDQEADETALKTYRAMTKEARDTVQREGSDRYVMPDEVVSVAPKLEKAREILSNIGDKIRSAHTGENGLIAKRGIRAQKKLERALKQDIYDALGQSAAPEKARAAYAKANAGYAQYSKKWKDRLVAKARDTQPEELANRLLSESGSVARRTFDALDARGKAAARYGIVSKIMENSATKRGTAAAKGGEEIIEISPAKLATALSKNETLLDTFMDRSHRDSLRGLQNVMAHIERSGSWLVDPPTGQRNLVPMWLQAIRTGSGLGTVGASLVDSGFTLATSLGIKALLTTPVGRHMLGVASKMTPGTDRFQKQVARMSKYAIRGIEKDQKQEDERMNKLRSTTGNRSAF